MSNAPTSGPKPTLEKFKKFVRAVANVPKRDLDAKLDQYERRRKRRKRPA